MMAEESQKSFALSRRFSVAPMMAWTDRHARYFLRLISQRALLYTEMVPVNALIYGDPERFLKFDQAEHPIALQLGGSDPKQLARGSIIGEQWGYDEINLNVGCPSDRVSSGNFGACLMAEPQLVADCVSAITEATRLPVSVKCRIGIDDMDTGAPLDSFVAGIIEAGCQVVVVHARKAWLKGLSPKENRDVPPLDYKRVHRLKSDFPDTEIIINGGITSIEDGLSHLPFVDGVMLGRAAYENPYLLSTVDSSFFGQTTNALSRLDVIERIIPYCEREISKGTPLHRMTRHILGLFHGYPGARRWRRHLSTNAVKPGASASLLYEALELMNIDRKAA
ncbi:MAG: tRNA dihydrouridine(20/20a) synthase DusA [Rhodospirillaceae bacterium]